MTPAQLAAIVARIAKLEAEAEAMKRELSQLKAERSTPTKKPKR